MSSSRSLRRSNRGRAPALGSPRCTASSNRAAERFCSTASPAPAPRSASSSQSSSAVLRAPALVHRLTALHTAAKVLFMSGYTDDVLAPHHFAVRSVAFLPKTFTAASLVKKVREVLDAPGGDLLTASAEPAGARPLT